MIHITQIKSRYQTPEMKRKASPSVRFSASIFPPLDQMLKFGTCLPCRHISKLNVPAKTGNADSEIMTQSSALYMTSWPPSSKSLTMKVSRRVAFAISAINNYLSCADDQAPLWRIRCYDLCIWEHRNWENTHDELVILSDPPSPLHRVLGAGDIFRLLGHLF